MRPAHDALIELFPLGPEVEIELLDELASALARAFQASCHTHSRALEIGFAYDPRRNQHHSTALLRHLNEISAGAQHRVLGVAAVDLFVPVLTFVFGEAQLQGHCAVMSLHRLRDEFYGLPPNPKLLADRLLKEAVHELGHTFGLHHCADWRCVMSSSHAVERLDVKTEQFCGPCLEVVRA